MSEQQTETNSAESREEPSSGAESEELTEDREESVMEVNVDEWESLQAERDELEEEILRKTADLDNLRKRKREEEQKLRKYSGQGVLRDLLEVVDNFDRALDSMEIESDDVRQGIEMIQKQLYEVLRKHDVESMEAEGDRFDPHRHDAMMQEPREDLDEKQVLEVFTEGYTHHDRVLRPASVKVGIPAHGDESISEEEENQTEE